ERTITLSEAESQTPLQPVSNVRTLQAANGRNSKLAPPKAPSEVAADLEETPNRADALSDRANVLPRSILRTVDRIRQDLDPQAEQQVVKNFRSSKAKTTTAVKFVLLLIIVPLLTQQFTKNFVVGPIVDTVRDRTHAEVFLNLEMEEEALHELQQFEERLRFEVLIGKAAPMPEREIEATVREKATEIEEDYRHRSADAVKNLFADIAAAGAFALLLISRKQEVSTLKGFMDEIVYGLSDSAKAFIIILFTDMFVGFHSPHGWEVLLEGLSRHLGFAANREFIFLFIATFPVILDTVFKYWIFRYLNRISPSAVATYRNMNE
ncbi:MAG: proton extrusion protein PcxA, partial [Tolypothrix sp. T3-bin4]|nr:proton extrusion protein PcxA [Tolypothrix sp. T3-bin4]